MSKSLTIIDEVKMKYKAQRNRRPTTPGEILKEEFLEPLELTQKVLADHLGVDVKVVNRIVNDKTSISPLMAVKLAYTFGTSPQFWVNAQIAVDLWDAEHSLQTKPSPIGKTA